MLLAGEVLALALIGLLSSARAAEPAVHLVGIATLPDGSLALLERESAPVWQHDLMMASGQRDNEIEVLDINPAAGKVRLKVEGTIHEIAFTTPKPTGTLVRSETPVVPGEKVNIRLQQAGLGQVFGLYQRLAQRSLIRPAELPDIRLDIYSPERVTTADFLRGIEQALLEKDIALKPDGDKFVIASQVGAPERITPQVREAAVELAAQSHESRSKTNAPPDSVLPAGVINFLGTDLNQVLDIFQELANRTLLRSLTLPGTPIEFRTYTPMTKAEAIYAFTAFLAVNGVSTFPVGDHFMFVCETVAAPKALKVLARRAPPSTSPTEERIPSGVSGVRVMELEQLLHVYGELTGKTVEVGNNVNLKQMLAMPRAQTPLTRQEVIYAFDLLLAWNGLEVTQDDGRAKLTRIKSIGQRSLAVPAK